MNRVEYQAYTPQPGMGGPPQAVQTGPKVPARPAKRSDSRRPRSRTRKRKRTGSVAWIGTAVTVVLIVVGVNLSRSTEPPAQEQPAATVSVTSPVVVPPLPTAATPYGVQAGDTLERIANASGVTVEDLLAWNPDIADRDAIDVGQAVITSPPTG
jgi:LysM repeat protein